MEIPLTPNANNDGSIDGNDGSNVESAADSRRASGDATASGSNGIAGESSARTGSDESGTDELPLGDGGYKKRSRKRKSDSGGSASAGDNVLRIGERRNGDSRSQTDSDSRDASGATAEEKSSSRARSIPREITLDSLGIEGKGKKEKPNANLSTEFIAEGFGIAFHACAILLNDNEWKLPEEDANVLAERTKNWIRTGSKNVAAFEKKLAKFEPLAMLLIGLFAVLLPRIIHTRNKRNALRIQAKASANANGSGTETAAPVQNSNGASPAGNSSGPVEDFRNNPLYRGARVDAASRSRMREILGDA